MSDLDMVDYGQACDDRSWSDLVMVDYGQVCSGRSWSDLIVVSIQYRNERT